VEVLLVDDGSTDGTAEWVRGHYENKIKYIWKENGGLSTARNLGLKHAKGEFIQFLDADDFISSDKVSIHAEFLEKNPEYAVVYCHSLCFYDDRPGDFFDWWGQSYYRSDDVFADMIDVPYMLVHAAVVRREWYDRIGGYDESLDSVVDGDFWLRIAHAGARFQFLPGPLAYYRHHRDSQSSASVGVRRNKIRVLRNLERNIPDKSERKRLRIQRSIGRYQGAYGLALMEAGEVFQGWVEVAGSLALDQRYLMPRLIRLMLVPLLGWDRTQRLIQRLKP
jgi:glycosyltransferase involved in cell wall biosynthesis